MSRLKLRTRLIILTLGSACLLTLITIGGTLWSYGQLRQTVTDDTSKALDSQTAAYLQQIAREKTGETSDKLTVVHGLVLAAHDYLQATAFESTLAFDELRPAPNGWQWGGKTTTTLVAPQGGLLQQRSDLQISQSLNALLPSLANSAAEIERISFLSANGVVRTYPFLDPEQLRPGWSIAADRSYVAAGPDSNPAREPVWVPLHDSYAGDDQVISIAKPVYFGNSFRGVLVADISLRRLTDYLETIGLEQGSFAALVDGKGEVVAASALGQERLLGRTLGADEQGPVGLSQGARAALGALLPAIVERQTDIAVVPLDTHEYIIAYTGVETLGWSLLIATPRDAVIQTTEAMVARIDQTVERFQTATLGVSALALLVLIGVAGLGLRHWFSRPLSRLMSATNTIAAGDLRPISIQGTDEIAELAQAFNHMVAALEASRAEIVAANLRLEQTVRERTADLQLAVDQLESATAQQHVLLQTLRAVSTPILPVIHDVLVVPLIGQLDEQRLANVAASLLSQIERSSARMVLIDVTGTPVIDTAAALGIVRLIQAARLLGCESMLVGIVPEVAQTLVTLGVDLSAILTAVDLQSGVEQIMRRWKMRRSTRLLPLARA